MGKGVAWMLCSAHMYVYIGMYSIFHITYSV